MGKLTLRLPETLHHQLKAHAKSEGVSLNQYIIYTLTQRMTPAYTIEKIPEHEVQRQRARYDALWKCLGQVNDTEIDQALLKREMTEPNSDLSPEVITRLQKRIAEKGRP